jgi:hypothetical protein
MEGSIIRGKLLRISSEDKQLGENNADFTVRLGNTSYVQNVRGVVLKHLSFKHVFPNVFYGEGKAPGDGNSTFSFSYNGTPQSVIVEEGWYTAVDYMEELERVINLLPAVINPITVSLPMVPAGASLTRKFTFTASGGDTIGLISEADGNFAADLVGIRTTTGQAVSHTAEWLPDFGGLSTIYLCSGVLAGYNASASSNSGEQVSIITPIPLDVDYGQEVRYLANEALQEAIIFRNDRNLNSVDLALCTRTGTRLSLQQNNLTATFRLLHAGGVPQD